MDLKALIKGWMEEGKNDAEIATLVAQHADAKGLTGGEIAGLIREQKKAEETVKALKDLEDEDKKVADEKDAKKDFKKEMNDAIDAKFKSININPLSNFQKQTELKRFNPRTKQVEVIKNFSGVYAGFNDMMKAFTIKDFKSAESISKSIDVDNLIKFNEAHGIKVTPTVSDVTTRGGYAIPTEVEMVITQLLYENSVMMGLVNTDNIVFEDKIYPLMYGITVGDIADQSTEITEKNPTFDNPTIAMERVGAYSTIARTIMDQKQADLANAFASSYASAFAEYFDLRLACGNVTTEGDLVDGMIFDSYIKKLTPIARTALNDQKILDLINALDPKANLSKTALVANRKIVGNIGMLENSAGNRLFPGYLEGKGLSPFGVPLKQNPQIPSTLDVGGDSRLTGTDDALIVADFSKVMTGVSPSTRIETSEHFKFTSDLITIKAVKRYGQKILSRESKGGVVAVVQELTN